MIIVFLFLLLLFSRSPSDVTGICRPPVTRLRLNYVRKFIAPVAVAAVTKEWIVDFFRNRSFRIDSL